MNIKIKQKMTEGDEALPDTEQAIGNGNTEQSDDGGETTSMMLGSKFCPYYLP